MNTIIISESDAATRIISLWKGFKVRKTFLTMKIHEEEEEQEEEWHKMWRQSQAYYDW
jgi:hypothetical protein